MVKTKQSDLKPVDWAGAEPHYRAGIRSLKSIGIEFGVSPQGVQKHFVKLGIKRDLRARIQAAAQELVLLEAVRPVAALMPAKEQEIIGTNASVLATVQIAHRRDIARLRRMANRMLDDLDDMGERPELFAMVHGVLDNPTEAGLESLRDFATSVANMPGRVAMLKSLVESTARIVGMEREAFGLDTVAGTDGRPLVIIRDFTGRGDPDAPKRPVEPGS